MKCVKCNKEMVKEQMDASTTTWTCPVCGKVIEEVIYDDNV